MERRSDHPSIVAGPGFDLVTGALAQQEGAFRRLPLARFEDSPLCDPCTMPWRADPARRD